MKKDQYPLMKPVSLEQLLKEETTYVDLYVQLSEKKFVLVAKAGTQTSSLARYLDRKVQYLHFRYDDLTKLLHQSMTVAGVMLGKDHISESAKVVALEQAVTSVYRNFESFGFNAQTISHAKVVTEATMTMCLGNNELEKLVSQLSQLENPLHRQALLTSALCPMLGVAMGYTVPSTLEKLSLGGFLLDIGKTKLPSDIISKPIEKFTKDEMNIYKNHVELGFNLAQTVRGLPYDVVLMIYEHHEFADGSGFPRRIKDLLMSPMGRIAVVANSFAEQVIGGSEPIKLHEVEGVVDRMCNHTSHLYNRDVLRALRTLLGERKNIAMAG